MITASRFRLLMGAVLLLIAAPHPSLAQEGPGSNPGPKGDVPTEMRKKIDKAIEDGSAYLCGSQAKDGSWSQGTGLSGDRARLNSATYRTAFEGALARTARAAEALLDAGLGSSDAHLVSAVDVVEAGMAVLERGPPPLFRHSEYAAAVLRLRLRARDVDDRSRVLCTLLESCIAEDGLFTAIVPHLGGARASRRAEPNGNAFSCFDVLSALDLARRCGVPGNRDLRTGVGRLLARCQRSDGGWNQWPAADGSATGEGLSKGTSWMLSEFGGTASSLAAYLLAAPPERTSGELLQDPTVSRGLSWLAANFAPWSGSKAASGGAYYSTRSYVNFLALAAIGDRLGETEWPGSFRWYEEGAKTLLRVQSRDGYWRHPVSGGQAGVFHQRLEDNTACAIIFLAAGRRRRDGSVTGEQARHVATSDGFATLDWGVIAGQEGKDRVAAFSGAFRLFARLDIANQVEESWRFTAFGPEVASMLIQCLESDVEGERSSALRALQGLLGETLEFDPAGSPEVRRAGLQSWRGWLLRFGDRLVLDGKRFTVRVSEKGK